MQPANISDLLEESLMVVAETGVDITAPFFDRFFAAFPEQRKHFFHPATTCGQMVNEILESVMAMTAGEPWVPTSIQSLVIAHRSFGDIPLEMYGQLLDLLVDTMRDVAGDRWTADYDAAWRQQCARLTAMIAHAY